MSFSEPKLAILDSFIVSGLSVRTKNSEEFNQSTAKLPRLWEDFGAVVIPKLADSKESSEVFGVYSDYDSDATGYYKVTVGIPLRTRQTLSEFSTVTIQAGKYLVFSGKGVMPQTVIETWLRIWSFFESRLEYTRNFISDFELYRGDEIDIYIGVRSSM
ncbi:Transcription activator [Legionella nautarum]|uniref:Transcription activator n=1 Tax=Legionella nautarum TaxID=45070 RepID=A0A0W0X3G9_9GAMM|nr:GyrI-like domain-containing protein [Legionella nautarum]KTD39141.1 Transcription activator [Legionella nautarum]